MAGYLFAHFTGEQKDGEQVYFSISRDGLFWTDLNKGKPILRSHIGEGGVRDPFLVKNPENGMYYLIATDLRIEAGKGWETAAYRGSRNLIVWESSDLVHWSEERSCRVGVEGAGCVWAPEAIYDADKRQFFVFFASMTKLPGDKEAKQRIYATYTEDFHTFSEPFVYIERKQHVIDTTMVSWNNRLYRFSKDETNSRIVMEKGITPEGDFEKVHSAVLEELEGVEGPECYLLLDGKTWCLIVDRFRAGKGYLPLLTENLESGQFRVPENHQFDMGTTKKRHGSVLRLEEEEYQRLWEYYG